MTDPALVERIELAVWKELGARRWFAKHVEEEEIQELEADLKVGIEAALLATTSTGETDGTQ